MSERDTLAALLDGVLPRMAFVQYGQFYNDDPDFDIEAYYVRVAESLIASGVHVAATPAPLQRWGLTTRPAGGLTTIVEIAPEDNGMWVKFSDVRALAAIEAAPTPAIDRERLIPIAARMVRLDGGCESGHKPGQWHMHEEPFRSIGRQLATLATREPKEPQP